MKGDRWLDAYIFVAGREAINSVHVGGRRLVSGGRHHAHDAIAKRYGTTMRRLIA